MLLASRPAWNEAQQSLATTLVRQVRQWDAFTEAAWRKFSLPMVYRNLAALPQLDAGDEVMPALRGLTLRMMSQMLRRQAAFDWFHANCVLPSGVDYAYFKGPALAASFYADPTLRYYRDVDILIPDCDQPELIRRMLDQGCTVYPTTHAEASAFQRATADELKRFLPRCSMPGMVTPQGLMVEIHETPDHKTYLFPTRDMLERADTVSTGRHVVRVLPRVPHIALVLYHHTSHLWSKYNWLADLDAICNDPDLDRAELLDYSKYLGIGTTIDAALGLHELAADGRLPSDFVGSAPAVDLLRVCIEGLAGDEELEKLMRAGQRMDTLSFHWQPNPLPLWRFVWVRLINYKPLFADFMRVPGGPTSRYVCSVAIGLMRSARRRLLKERLKSLLWSD